MATAAIIFYAKYSSELYEICSSKETLDAWLKGFGTWGKVVFVLIRALQTVVKFVPAEPLEIGSGYVFGTFGGCLLCSLGTFLGSLVIVLLTKFAGTRIINAMIPEKRIVSVQGYLERINVGFSLAILYLIPGTPKDLITYFIFMLPISVPKFFLITTFARLPSIISSTWCGSVLGQGNYIMSAVIFAATVVAGVVSGAVYAKVTKDKEKKKEQGETAA